MRLNNLEKKEAQLKKINEEIKNEKSKIEKKLGHEIIKSANLSYSDLDQESIKNLANKIASHLLNNNQNTSENNEEFTTSTNELSNHNNYSN